MTNRSFINSAAAAIIASGLACAAEASPSSFEDAPTKADEANTLSGVTVSWRRDPLDLDKPVETASRLALTARETPASVETLSRRMIDQRGLRTSREAFAEVTGAIAGNVPGNPAVVTLRGFSGGAVSILQDGVRVSTSTVVARDANTWHYDRIEVIKGPASVLYGEGALAGVINKVTRRPTLDGDHVDLLASYGSFGASMIAGGANLRLTDKTALRFDASRLNAKSLYDVHHNATRSTGLTASLLYQPSARASVLIAAEHYEDRSERPYNGVPLVARSVARDPSDVVRSANGLVLDRALRRVNYNPEGSRIGARETTLRAHAAVALDGGWSLTSDLAWYLAKRDFVLSDTQVFQAPSATSPNGAFARSAIRFYHDHQFWNARVAAANDATIAGRRNRFSLGAEHNDTDFKSLRQASSLGALSSVDIFDPKVGAIPTDPQAYRASNVLYDSPLSTTSVFAEDALNLTDDWLLVGGVRYDRIVLDRQTTDYNAGGAVSRARHVYEPVTWRLGTTWAINSRLTAFGQYTTAAAPVASTLLQSIANTRFKLTTGASFEAGFKADLFEGRLGLTASAFDIRQKDILTRDPTAPTQVVQGGEQSAQGVELTAAARVTRRLSINLGAALTDARYERLSELVGGIRFDRSGMRPVNTPGRVFNLNAQYEVPASPVTLGATLKQVGGFYTDTANSYRVAGHTTLDLSASLKVASETQLTIRLRNVTDAFYGEYSGYSPTNIYVGAPRGLELSLRSRL